MPERAGRAVAAASETRPEPRRLRRLFVMGGFDRRQYLAPRALVVLRKIDLDPWQSTRADRVKGAPLREFVERARRPVAKAAGCNDAIEDRDQMWRALPAELHDAEVLAVRFVRGHRLRHVDHPAAADLHLHLFVAEGLAGLAPGHEQCGVMVCNEQVTEQRGMEENVTIEHHEPLIQQSSCRPQRIKAVRFREAAILYIRHTRPAGLA